MISLFYLNIGNISEDISLPNFVYGENYVEPSPRAYARNGALRRWLGDKLYISIGNYTVREVLITNCTRVWRNTASAKPERYFAKHRCNFSL